MKLNNKGLIGLIVASVAIGSLVVIAIVGAVQHFAPNLVK